MLFEFKWPISSRWSRWLSAAQVAKYAGQLPELSDRWDLLQFRAAAGLVEAAAAAGSIPPEHALEAASALCNRIVQWIDETEKATSDHSLDHARGAAAVFGQCMRHIAGATAAAAAELAAASGPWQQEAARLLVCTTIQLCAWLLTPLATENDIAASVTQQHVAALLEDGGPAAQALQVASAARRSKYKFVFDNQLHWAALRSGPEMLPSMALAACMLCMLCSGGGGSSGSGSSGSGSGESSELGPLSASCLGTAHGDHRLRLEVPCPERSAGSCLMMRLQGLRLHGCCLTRGHAQNTQHVSSAC